MKDLEECLEQLSPLMDDAVERMRSMGLTPAEHIALGFLASADFSMRSALSLPAGNEELTDEQRDCIMTLLNKKKREADEIMQAAAQRFMLGNMVQ